MKPIKVVKDFSEAMETEPSATSVIIPAYNNETSVHISIESALNQSRTPHEVIVIDDGSTDRTPDVVGQYGNRVILVKQENQGQGAARNAGLKIASGRFVAFLDADDYWKPEFIQKMEAFLDRHPKAIAASCAFLVKRARGDYIGPLNSAELRQKYPEGLILDDFFSFWARYDHVRTGTVLIKREAVESVGLQNQSLRISQDLEYWGLIATAGPWGLLPEILWVGTSDIVARESGWRKKYAQRRSKTPTVEAWQARILPRLPEHSRPGFYKVRGRVAAGYMVNHVLGGAPSKGQKLLRDYGNEMPEGKTLKILKIGNRLGILGWWVAGAMLRLYDRLK